MPKKKKEKFGEPSSEELKKWWPSLNIFSKESANIQRRKDTMGILQRMKHRVKKEDIHLAPEKKKGKRDYSILGKIFKGFKKVRELDKKKK